MSKKLKYLLLFSVAGLMFCIIPVDGAAFRLSWQLAALWMGGLAFALEVLSSWWLRIFWLIALWNTATNFPPNYDAYISLLTLAVFLAAAEGFRRIDRNAIMVAMRVAAGCLLVWMFLQEAGFLRTWFAPRNAGPFNPNAGGVFLALCLPAFLSGWWWVAAPVVALGIFVTKTTTAMLAAVAAMTVYLIAEEKMGKRLGWTVNSIWGRNVRAPMLGMVLLLILLSAGWFSKVDSLSNITQTDRWTAWKHAAWSMRSEMCGRGLGSWEAVFPLLASGDRTLNVPGNTPDGKPATMVFQQAHNEYVQVAFELGVQALVLVGVYLLTVAGRIWNGRITPDCAAGITALVVSCFGFFVFHEPPTAVLGVAWLGMIEGLITEA